MNTSVVYGFSFFSVLRRLESVREILSHQRRLPSEVLPDPWSSPWCWGVWVCLRRDCPPWGRPLYPWWAAPPQGGCLWPRCAHSCQPSGSSRQSPRTSSPRSRAARPPGPWWAQGGRAAAPPRGSTGTGRTVPTAKHRYILCKLFSFLFWEIQCNIHSSTSKRDSWSYIFGIVFQIMPAISWQLLRITIVNLTIEYLLRSRFGNMGVIPFKILPKSIFHEMKFFLLIY